MGLFLPCFWAGDASKWKPYSLDIKMPLGWLLSVDFFSCLWYVTQRGDKNPRWFPANYLENKILGTIPVFARIWQRGEVWWKSCVSSSLSSFTANRPKQPVEKTHLILRFTLIRMALVTTLYLSLDPAQGWDHHEGNHHILIWIIIILYISAIRINF